MVTDRPGKSGEVQDCFCLPSQKITPLNDDLRQLQALPPQKGFWGNDDFIYFPILWDVSSCFLYFQYISKLLGNVDLFCFWNVDLEFKTLMGKLILVFPLPFLFFLNTIILLSSFMILTKVGKWLWNSCQMEDTGVMRLDVQEIKSPALMMVSKAEFVVTNFFIPWCVSQQSMWTGICKLVYYVGVPFLLFVRLPLRELMNY